MKNRVLSLVVSLAMVFTMITPAYANTDQTETPATSVIETVDTSETLTVTQAENTGETEQVNAMPAAEQSKTDGTLETSGVSETLAGSQTGGENAGEVQTEISSSSTETPDGSGEVPATPEVTGTSEPVEVLGTSETLETSETPEVPVTEEGSEPEAAPAEEPAADLGLNGSQVRLFVGTSDPSILDADHILSGYNGLYILAYGSAQEAAIAYSKLAGRVSFIAYDKAVITVADIEDVSGQVQTDSSNAVAELSSTPAVWGGGMIALIDTGASGSNVVSAVSMLGDDPSDDNGHGTRMAELIAAQNPNAQILSIKAFDSSGHASPSTLYTAIQYAINAGVSVINLSVSGYATADTAPIAGIINEAIANGITVIGAAGNNATDAAYTIPGSIDGAIIAGSASEDGARAGFSNYGGTVDWYVVSGSTSEAAAILSGIYTREGIIAADKVTVFVPGYDPMVDGNYEWQQLSSDEIDARFGVVREDGFDVADTVYLTITQNGWASFDTVEAPILYAGGNLAQCTVASAPLPNGQTLAFNRVAIDSSSSAGLQLLSKALYYGSSNFGLTHFAVSYIAAYHLGIGRTDLWHVTSPTYGLQLSAAGQATVINWVNSLASQPNVSGTLYYTSTAYSGSGVQDVAFGSFTVSAELSLNKVSTDAGASDLSNAVFGVYNTEANAVAAIAAGALTGNEIGVFATTADGTGVVQSTAYTKSADNLKITGLPMSSQYWVIELTAPEGFAGKGSVYWLNPSAGGGIVNPPGDMDAATQEKMRNASSIVQTGNSIVITAANAPNEGYLKVVKTSADTTLTSGNSCYSLENAAFAVFDTQASANTAAANPSGYESLTGYLGELTTDADGNTGTLKVKPGTVYVAEVTAPKGYARNVDVKTVTVTSANTETAPASATFSDIPLSDPIPLLLMKRDAKTGEDVRRVG